MNSLTVTSVKVKGNSLRVHFKCTSKVRKFFNSNTFFVEYDTSIENVPESILIIPFLSTVCPVAWACKADIYIENIDEKFYESLEKIQKIFQKFHPKIGFKGTTHAKNITKTNAHDHTKSMMLFSGGVDSISTYIRHRNEKPVMVIIKGADIHIDNNEAWKTTINAYNQFARETKSKMRIIKSNFRDLLNEYVLSAYYEKKINDYWYRGIFHGFALVGLCAPLTFVDKIGKIYHAATYTKDIEKKVSPHLEIDENNKWAGTTVECDGIELSRQEKLFVISDYIKTTGHKFHIRSCMEQKKKINCSICEKCSRTLLGLEAAGIDPNKVGFEVNNDTFLTIKKKIENNQLISSLVVAHMWKDIQRHAGSIKQTPHSGAQDLLNWIVTIDIEAHVQKTKKSSIPSFRILCRRYLPFSVYSLSKRVFEKFHKYS